jgi:hypothetical protein
VSVTNLVAYPYFYPFGIVDIVENQAYIRLEYGESLLPQISTITT